MRQASTFGRALYFNSFFIWGLNTLKKNSQTESSEISKTRAFLERDREAPVWKARLSPFASCANDMRAWLHEITPPGLGERFSALLMTPLLIFATPFGEAGVFGQSGCFWAKRVF